MFGLEKPVTLTDTTVIMTTSCTRTLYAPNPPQIDEPWLRIALLLVVLVLIASAVLGS